MLVQNHIFHKRSYFLGWNKIHKHHPLVLTLASILQKRICNTSKNTLSHLIDVLCFYDNELNLHLMQRWLPGHLLVLHVSISENRPLHVPLNSLLGSSWRFLERLPPPQVLLQVSISHSLHKQSTISISKS